MHCYFRHEQIRICLFDCPYRAIMTHAFEIGEIYHNIHFTAHIKA